MGKDNGGEWEGIGGKREGQPPEEHEEDSLKQKFAANPTHPSQIPKIGERE